mgnify:FL=1
MEEKGAIYREKNPDDGRGILIKLTPFGIDKRNISKEHVILFNETVKSHISAEKIKTFFEVTETINKLVSEKAIFENIPTK